MSDATFLQVVVHFARPVHEENKVGAKRAIDQKFATPVSVRTLLLKKISLRLLHRRANLSVSGRECLAWAGTRTGQRDYVRRTMH